MATISTIKENHYQDSMKLMQISQKLSALTGIRQAAAIMATEANLAMLKEAGLIKDIPSNVSANDLIVAVEAQSAKLGEEAIDKLDSLLMPIDTGAESSVQYKYLDTAYGALPGANIAAVSVPGEYAKLEVAKAIEKGMHTFLFSDNLTLDEEIELKQRASGRGLLVMGPGCGTAIINGIGLGFANVVERGPIGVIAAAGTGMQEVTSLIDNLGSGVSHAIGVGGRDLSKEVGGIMTLDAIGMLERDQSTKALLIVSKPPSAEVAEAIASRIRETNMHAVVCFLGSDMKNLEDGMIIFTKTLEEAVLEALRLVVKKGRRPEIKPDKNWKKQTEKVMKAIGPKQKYLRGLYSGGTLCYETQQVLTPVLGPIHSNAPLNKAEKLKDSNKSVGNSCIDLGEEEFTVGRPHPMIDASLRSERLLKEAARPDVAVILLDIVLGYVASPDPAGDLIPAIREAKDRARKKGRTLAFVAHVCGTEKDPQGLIAQENKLRQQGVMVFPTNALAAKAAGWIVSRGGKL